MFITLIVSYIMIVQYLVNVPKYFEERPILEFDHSSGCSNTWSYIIGSAIAELPEAAIECACVVLFGYLFSESWNLGSSLALNPYPANAAYFGIILYIGVLGFQGLTTLCSMLGSNDDAVYRTLFLAVGLSSLCGGLLIRKDDLHEIFMPFYWMGTTALTLRATLINDFYCCNLTTTCDDLNQQTRGRSEEGVCPMELNADEVPDGSILDGNMGRLALEYLGFVDEPHHWLVFATLVF
eukprot:UN29206